MRKYFLTLLMAIFVTAFAGSSANAQFTITIPKIPKIKKTKPDSQPTTTNSTDGTTTQTSNTTAKNDKCSDNIWLQTHVEDINKRRSEVDSYTPGRDWFVVESNYDHLLFAVSPSAKQRWLTGANALEYKDCPSLVTALDQLNKSASAKLPTYIPDTKSFAIKLPAYEQLMKGKIKDLADHKIFHIGVKQASWLIDKNNLGIPKSRYKHGMAWVRYVPNDHPYCRVYWINIIQDYAGGGTYGDSYAYFVRDDLAGCPAGAK
jgi:hypothetical protein